MKFVCAYFFKRCLFLIEISHNDMNGLLPNWIDGYILSKFLLIKPRIVQPHYWNEYNRYIYTVGYQITVDIRKNQIIMNCFLNKNALMLLFIFIFLFNINMHTW